MRKIAILGAGRFGVSLITYLSHFGADVLVLDRDEEKINALDDTVSLAVCVDVTDERALARLGLTDVDVGVVCLGDNVEGSLLATVVLQRLQVREIWVRAVSDVQQQILRALGVARILSIEDEMGKQMAYNLFNPGMHLFLSLAPEHNIVEIKAGKPFVGKSLADIDFRNRYGVNIVAIKTPEKETLPDSGEGQAFVVNDLPGAGDIIRSGDVLIMIGSMDNLTRIQRLSGIMPDR